MKWLLIFLCFISALGFAQNAIQVPRTTSQIELDGQLNEPFWQNAHATSDFKQFEPNIGAAATESVRVYLTSDKEYLYIAAEINYQNLSELFATTLERDIAQVNDDYFEIHLDTYNDKTNTLVFRTNPHSTRQDFEVSRNGEFFNTSWNTFWDAKSQTTETGWSTEMRIPFSSLRYKHGDENTMRVKFVIKYKEKNETIVYPLLDVETGSGLYHFNNSLEITFRDLPSAKPLYITPYIKGNVIHENLENEATSDYEGHTSVLERKSYSDTKALDKLLSNVGLDVKYRPSPSKTLDLTLNTDFAEVEADDRIVNISRFPIFLPEKRLFFLENADLFNSNQFDHRLFHSRRIGIEDGTAVPIIGGARFTSNNATWQYGLLGMQTHKTENVASANMSVFRFRRSVGKLGSNIGIMNTNKLTKGQNNHLVATDANLRFTNTVRARLAAGMTFDDITGNWKPMYGVSVNTFKNNRFRHKLSLSRIYRRF